MVQGAGICVSVVDHVVGDVVAVRDVEDAELNDHADVLEDEGTTHVRVSALSAAELASDVTPSAGRNGRPFGMVVVSTDSTGDVPMSDWIVEYQERAGLESTRALSISGAACANFVAGVDVCRGLIAVGETDPILLVLADRVLTGSRYTPVSKTACSDAAASCLVSATPGPGAFEVLATATEIRLPRDGRWGDLADARTTLTGLGAAARRVIGDQPPERFRHLITLNLGATARQLLAMATPLPRDRLYSGGVERFGHCFAADIPLNLYDLKRSGLLGAGDEVLALATGRHALSAVALRYCGS